VQNYASPLAQEFWYYLRSIGHVKHRPGWVQKHYHMDGYVLHVVQRGELWHEIKGRRYVARRGSASLLDLRQDMTYGVGGAHNVELYWALLNGRDMPRMFLELGADQDPLFLLRDRPRVESYLRELMTLTIHESLAYEARSSGLLMLILAELFASRADRARLLSLSKANRPLSESVRKGLDYLIRHYDHPVSLKQAADVAGTTLAYFSRLFHKEVGMSPIAYLNRFRIEQAKTLLTNSNQSIAQIARNVSFHSQGHFTRLFLRIVGVTPTVYRRNPKKSRQSR